MFDIQALPNWSHGDVATVAGLLFATAFGLGWATSRLFRRRPAAEFPPQAAILPSYRATLTVMSRELNRVRRYDRSLALLVLKPQDAAEIEGTLGLVESSADGNGSNGKGDASHADRERLLRAADQVAFWNLGYVLQDLVRESDVAACDATNRRYVVLLPDAGDDLANLAGQRIQERLAEALGLPLRTGAAVYRTDGLTIEDLVQIADARCDRGGVSRPAVLTQDRRARFRRIADSRSS